MAGRGGYVDQALNGLTFSILNGSKEAELCQVLTCDMEVTERATIPEGTGRQE